MPPEGWTLDYSISDGTTSAADFTGATTGSVGVAEGDTSKTITLQTSDDSLDEESETFTLSVTRDATAGPNTATGTINDDADGPPSTVSVTDVEVSEGAGTANFTVQLSGPSGKDITVGYQTGNGSATSPGDYTGGRGTISILAGAMTGTVSSRS